MLVLYDVACTLIISLESLDPFRPGRRLAEESGFAEAKNPFHPLTYNLIDSITHPLIFDTIPLKPPFIPERCSARNPSAP